MMGPTGEVQDLAGDLYTGQWEGDRKHGYGRYVWSDGDVYEGEFRDGEQCGRGADA